MLTRRHFLSVLAATPVFPRLANAATDPVYAFEGIAIHGYDPVAYFTEDAPLAGDVAITANWMGAMFRFASAANRTTFLSNPVAYAPQYGGYCAYAMSKGAIAPTVPEAFTIHEGLLYLNFSLSVMSIWREDIPGNIAKANIHWPGILDQ